MIRDFFADHYKMKFSDGLDEIVVKKISHSDWCDLTMMTRDGLHIGEITLRGQAMVEQLYFTIGQMLGK